MDIPDNELKRLGVSASSLGGWKGGTSASRTRAHQGNYVQAVMREQVSGRVDSNRKLVLSEVPPMDAGRERIVEQEIARNKMRKAKRAQANGPHNTA